MPVLCQNQEVPQILWSTWTKVHILVGACGLKFGLMGEKCIRGTQLVHVLQPGLMGQWPTGV